MKRRNFFKLLGLVATSVTTGVTAKTTVTDGIDKKSIPFENPTWASHGLRELEKRESKLRGLVTPN